MDAVVGGDLVGYVVLPSAQTRVGDDMLGGFGVSGGVKVVYLLRLSLEMGGLWF